MPIFSSSKIKIAKSKPPKAKNPNPTIIELSDSMFIRNIEVKRDWMYAELVIRNSDNPYLGKWEYKDTALPAILGSKTLNELIVPIKKRKREWDKIFWDTASMFSNVAYNTKGKDLSQIWKDTNIVAKERQMLKLSSEEERAEESRILQRSW